MHVIDLIVNCPHLSSAPAFLKDTPTCQHPISNWCIEPNPAPCSFPSTYGYLSQYGTKFCCCFCLMVSLMRIWHKSSSPSWQIKGLVSAQFWSAHVFVSDSVCSTQSPEPSGSPTDQRLNEELLLSDHLKTSLNRLMNTRVPFGTNACISWFSSGFLTLTRSVCCCLQNICASLHVLCSDINTYLWGTLSLPVIT